MAVEITGTIPGIIGYTISELAEIWEAMKDCPDSYSALEMRLACMAVGLANQIQRRPLPPMVPPTGGAR